MAFDLWSNVDAALNEATKFYGSIRKTNATYGGKSPSPVPPPQTVTGLPPEKQTMYLVIAVSFIVIVLLFVWQGGKK